MFKNIVKAEPLIEVNAAGLGVAFTKVGSFDHACFMIRINNTSNQPYTISYDGVTDHDFILANQVIEIYTQANAAPPGKVALFPKNMSFWLAGIAGVGDIYIVGYYQDTI